MNEYTQYLQKIEAVLQKKLPIRFFNELQKAYFGVLPESVNQTHFEKLIEPNIHLLNLGGKRWRPLLLVLCAHMVSGSKSAESAYELVPAVEFTHTASLIHDDIEDGADLRRGKPAAHIVFGIDTALNSASWLYFAAAECVESFECEPQKKIALLTLLNTQIRKLHLGQSMDITWHKSQDYPTINEYEAMIQLKTGTLANLAAQLGILCGGGSMDEAQNLGNLAAKIGAGFQILDDVINITSGNAGKKRGDDIVEGKKSLPVLLHIQKNPRDTQKINSYFNNARTDGMDSPAVEECINLLQSSNSHIMAKEYASGLITSAVDQIQKSYPDTNAKKLLCGLFLDMLK